jgi:hypothetical protein
MVKVGNDILFGMFELSNIAVWVDGFCGLKLITSILLRRGGGRWVSPINPKAARKFVVSRFTRKTYVLGILCKLIPTVAGYLPITFVTTSSANAN